MTQMELRKKAYAAMAVQTVNIFFEGYVKHEVSKANIACWLQGMVGHPSNRKYKDMVYT